MGRLNYVKDVLGHDRKESHITGMISASKKKQTLVQTGKGVWEGEWTFGNHAIPAIAHGKRCRTVLHLQKQLHAVHGRRRCAAHSAGQPCGSDQAA